MKSVLITHNDFDGVVCAVLFKSAYPDATYYLEDYGTVDERIKQVLDEEPDVLYITDISPCDEAVLKALDIFYFNVEKEFALVLLDHHKTAIKRLEQYPWAVASIHQCGARMLFSHFAHVGLPPLANTNRSLFADYSELVYHANDYDLWHHESPHSSVLNSLVYVLGQERFINRFLENPSVGLTETEKLMLEIEAEKQEQYIREAAKNAVFYPELKRFGGPVVAVVFAEKYISQLGEFLLNMDMSPNSKADIAAIVNAQKGTVSLRSKTWDVSIIAKACGGGGHEKAAGFELKGYWLSNNVARMVLDAVPGGEKFGSHYPE